MHPTPLTPVPDSQPPRPTKTEIRGGAAASEPSTGERATSSDEEAMLLGGAPPTAEIKSVGSEQQAQPL